MMTILPCDAEHDSGWWWDDDDDDEIIMMIMMMTMMIMMDLKEKNDELLSHIKERD